MSKAIAIRDKSFYSLLGLNVALLAVCVVLLRPFTAMAADDLRTMPTGTLFDRGRDCLSDPAKADSALIYYTAVVDRYQGDHSLEGRHYLARAYNNRGYVWEYCKYDYKKATKDLLKSLDICESIPDKIPTEAYVCLNLANIFDTYANHQDEPNRYKARALEYWERSMDVAKNLKEWEIMLRSFIPLAAISVDQVSSPDGRARLKRLSAKFRESKIPNGIPMVNYCRTRAAALQALADGDTREAARLFRKETSLIDTDITPERYEIDTYNGLLVTYLITGKTDSVAYYIDLMEKVIETYDLKELRPLLIKTKLEYLPEAILRQSSESLRANLDSETDTILRGLKLDKISDIYLERRIDKSIQKEEELKKSKMLDTKIIATVSAGLAAAILLTVLLFFRLQSLKRRNRQLYEIAHAQSSITKVTAEESTSAIADKAVKLSAPKYAGSSLTEENLHDILSTAISLLDSTDEIYSPEFSLSRLADMAATKTRYLSQAISEIDGRNFNAIVNERRIHEACRRFDDTRRYGHLTVEAVGQSVGFKSRSAFTDAFKKTAGMTPSAYAKIARSKGET